MNPPPPAPSPYAQPGPYATPPEPPPRRGVRRRGLLLGGLGVLAAAGGVGAVAATRHSSAVASVGGSDPNAWDPGTLPGADAGGAGITTQDVRNVLDALNRALTAGNVDAYLAVHAASAAADARQRFENLQRIPFDQASYQLLGSGSRDFQTGPGAQQQIDIAFVHKITGVDVRPVAEWYRITLARAAAADPPRITAATGSPSANGTVKYVYYPAPWDAGAPITVVRRANVVLAAVGAKDAATAAKAADLAAAAVAENTALWKQGGGPDGYAPGIFALGTSDTGTFEQWWSGKANKKGSEAGLTIPLVDAASMDNPDAPRRTVGGARIILDLTSDFFTGDSGEENRKTLIKHEAWHALVAPLVTGDGAPLWVDEGGAEWAAKHAYSGAIRNDPNLVAVRDLVAGRLGSTWDGASLPRNDQVYATGEATNAGYGLSSLAFYYIAETFGLPALIAFAAANYKIPADPSGINGTDDLAAAVQKTLHVDLPAFQRGWAAFVHAHLQGA